MTRQQATVDGDQLAVLRLLRQRFGEVEVLEVRPSAELLPAVGVQAQLPEEPCPTPS